MKKLETAFTFDGYCFKQLDRVGDVAIYHKTKGLLSESFEVVIIQKRDAHTWPNGVTTPAHEAMPSSEQWGVKAWTYTSREMAVQRFELIAGQPEGCSSSTTGQYNATAAIVAEQANV